ncbi:hypothetical protein [Actinomadura logoneensis]|nr:hypothetical protein [Actinomadura logoneensis]
MMALAAINDLHTPALLFTGAAAVVSLVLAGTPRPTRAAARVLALALTVTLEIVVAALAALALLALVVFYLQSEDGPVSTTLLLVLGSLGGCGALAAITGWHLRPAPRASSHETKRAG